MSIQVLPTNTTLKGPVELGLEALPGGPLDGSYSIESKDENKQLDGSSNTSTGGSPDDVEKQPVITSVSFPDGGLKAWSVVLGAWCVSFTTWGFTNSYGVFQAEYTMNQLKDKTPSDISWIGSFQLSMVLACAIISGKAFDAGYVKYLLFGATAIYAAGIFGLSFATTYTQVFLAQGVACGLAAGMLFLPAASSISHFFSVRRATALGVFATGSSIGGIVYPILLNKTFNSSIGFAMGVRISGILTVVLLLIACFTIDTRLPPRKGGKIVDFTVFKDPILSIFTTGAFLVLLGMYTPYFFLQTYAIQNGVDKDLAFYGLAILNGSSVFGRLIPNYLADSYGPLTILAPNTLLSGILILLFIPMCKSAGGLIAFCIIFGFTSGAYVSMLPACVANMTAQMNQIGIRLAMIFIVTSLAALLGSPIAGFIIVAQGGLYIGAAIFSSISAIIGSCLIILARSMLVKRKGTQWV